MTESVGRNYLGIEEFIVSARTDEVVAPIVAPGASCGAAEEQWRASVAGGQKHPSHSYLFVGESGRFVMIAIGVVRFNPCDQTVGTSLVVPRFKVDTGGRSFFKNFSEFTAIVACRDVDKLRVFALFNIQIGRAHV